MNQEETIALTMLTGKAALDEVSVAELEEITNRYPYFAAAQLLLSIKMQRENTASLPDQLYKTALFFPDEPWLRYLLLETKETYNANSGKNPEEKTNASLPVEKKTKVQDNETKDVNYLTGNLPFYPVKNDLEETAPFLEPGLGLIPTGGSVWDEPEELPLDDEEAEAQASPLPIDESQQKIASILAEQAEVFHQAIPDETTVPVVTEPYHTIDYFASQGIALDAKRDEAGTSFDKKVHKFTDWLRQMKRINPHPIDLGTDSEQESFIAGIAATSNETREIVTESMAEVLVKQKKSDKAIEIYEKLSLLYPAKSAYFAAIIDQIKL